MLRQRVDAAIGVAPAPGFPVGKMPADERKQQRIAAADLGRIRPVGRVGPVQDLFALVAPAHQPPARLGCEQQQGAIGAVIADADKGAFLEVGGRKVVHEESGVALLA